jgi:hypothetical protein
MRWAICSLLATSAAVAMKVEARIAQSAVTQVVQKVMSAG